MDTHRKELRGSALLLWGLMLGLLPALPACGASSGNGPTPAQAVGGTGGSSAGNSAEIAGAAGAAAGGGGTPATCPGPKPTPLPGATTPTPGRVDLPVQFVVNQTAMTIGTPVTGRTGLEYKLSALELFLAEPALVDANGQEFKAQIVAGDGTPLSYGIQLVNADDPATEILHLSAPQGSYAALKLGVGVPAGCNATSSTDAVYPLDPDSQMFWTWGSQFLFIRIEGATRLPPTTDFTTFFHHVGYDPAYTHLTVPGSVSVAASGGGPALVIDVDLMLAGNDTMPSGPVPSGSHGVPDGWVVDNLETKQVFTLR